MKHFYFRHLEAPTIEFKGVELCFDIADCDCLVCLKKLLGDVKNPLFVEQVKTQIRQVEYRLDFQELIND